MAFKTLWVLMPKWLLVGLVACFFAYYTGISHGREPYKLAAKTNDYKVSYETKITKQIIDKANLEERVLNENLKNYNCVIDGNIANQLSDNNAHQAIE